MRASRTTALVGALAVATALAVPALATQHPTTTSSGPGCRPNDPAVAHHAGGQLLVPQPTSRPVPCGVFTGFGGSETRIQVTNDGTVVYEPAVLTPGLAGTGFVPGAPGPRPQTQLSPAGLATSRNNGGQWKFVEPAGVTWVAQDDQIYVDRTTGRLFYYALSVNPAPQSGNVALQDQIPAGEAHLATSGNDGRSWYETSLPGYVESENPRFMTGRAPAGQPQPANYPNVAYWCGNTMMFTYIARLCYRSLDAGLTWQQRSILFSRGVPQHSECGSNQEEFEALDGNYPQAAPDGSLYVMVSCGGTTYLARSNDEAASFPILKDAHGQPLQIPAANELRIDPEWNFYAFSLSNDKLFLRTSSNRGLSWSKPLDITAPGASNIAQWFVAIRGAGQISVSYLAQRTGQNGLFPMLTASHNALASDPTFYSAALSTTAIDAQPGMTAKDDFIGADVGRDGTPWGSYYADCPANSTDAVCTQGDGMNFEVNRAFAGRLVWPS